MKALLVGLVFAFPSVAAWMIRGAEPEPAAPVVSKVPEAPPAESPVQVPVEIVANGSASQWVYVQVPDRSVPEPGCVSLLILAGLLTLRRQRR